MYNKYWFKSVKIKNIAYVLNHIENYISIAALIAFFGVICVSVFSRYVLGAPLIYGDEFSRFLFIFMVLFGASAAVKTKSHIAVSFITKSLPKKHKEIIEFFIDILIIFFLLNLIYWGTLFAYRVRKMVTPAMEIPWIYIYSFIPLIATLMCVQYVLKNIKKIMKIFFLL